jgi:hypothetical protein
MGGSQWMRNAGLLQDPKSHAAGLAGETLGLLAGPLAAAKAPQIAAGLLQGGANLAAPATLNKQAGAIVWHGSPHKFDAFDSSKIGTGEGAQAYGHGLYLAENPSVAREYQEKLSSVGGAKNLASQYGDIDGGIAEATKRIQHYKQLIADGGGGDLRRANGMLNIAQKNLEDLTAMKAGLPENTGSLYKVDLPDEHIARMLDWDKPLSQQAPHIRDSPEMKGFLSQETGQEIYNILSKELAGGSQFARGKNDAAADILRKAGIPGIRYLDGGSRGAGQGTSNFVVFPGNEGLLQILERNGQAVK